MEYIHTVLAQIAANKANEAEPLIRALESHRAIASTMRGYQGMRVSRTAHPEGNVQLVVETRWSNNNTMVDYSTARENAFSIVEGCQDILVPGSLQTHRLESLTGSEPGEAPTKMYDRLALALFVPLGVLAFALVAIYGLSRIYLSLPAAGASIMAVIVALLIMGLSFYFASTPSVPRWQWIGVAVVGAAALGIGGTVAGVYDENNKEVHSGGEGGETPVVQPTPGGTPGAPVIEMEDNKFLETTLTIPSGQDVVIQVSNLGAALHNVHIATAGAFEAGDTAICKKGAPGCSDPANIRGGQSGTNTVNLAPGTYAYRCDFHIAEMQGTLTVQ